MTDTPQHEEQDVFVLIKRLQQQLVFLEKKIDLLISQSQEKPARTFERPYRPAPYDNKRGQGEDRRERNFPSTGVGHYSDKRPRDENRGYGGPKREYRGDNRDTRDSRDSNSGYDRPFKKSFDGKKRGFAPKGKPFFQKRRDQ